MPNGWWYMPPEPVPADPGWDEDLTWLARDLAGAAAQNPKTTWCVTVTDEKGHAVGHGCTRPEPKSHTKRAGPGRAHLYHRTHPLPHLTGG